MGRQLSSNQVIHMRRPALLSAVAATLCISAAAPAVSAAVPLTVWTTGAGGVSVRQPQPAPFPTCFPDRCVYQIASGTRVQLTVSLSGFRGWAGPCLPGAAPAVCSFVLTGPTTVGARFTAPASQQTAPQCNVDVCTDQGPLSGGVTVKVKVRGTGAVNVRAQSNRGAYNRTCSTTCPKLTVRAGNPVSLRVVRGALVRFSGSFPASNSSMYQVPALPPSGNTVVINADFRP